MSKFAKRSLHLSSTFGYASVPLRDQQPHLLLDSTPGTSTFDYVATENTLCNAALYDQCQNIFYGDKQRSNGFGSNRYYDHWYEVTQEI
jgi:hypothetical protein